VAHATEDLAEDEHSGLGFERVVFFSDAVFAIVITLLVLPLTAEIEPPERGVGYLEHVAALWPRISTFAITFLVVGQFWIAHHRTFGRIRRSDTGLVWLNLVCLLTVAFMPFPAALLGGRTDRSDQFPVVFMAASMTLTSALLSVTWFYAWRRGLADLARDEARLINRRSLVTTAVFAVSIPVGLLGLPAATLLWLVVLPAGRTLVGRVRRRTEEGVPAG
jgi:uncharacterized membrane protein